MRTAAFLWVMMMLCVPLAHALAPSEILYDPSGSDAGKEFIELIGTEPLADCSIRDSASADTLALLRAAQGGSDVILIVESDGIYTNLSTTAAVYGAGKAIGNGLGNTAESITVSCEGEVRLSIAYNTSELPDIPEGSSIVWDDAMGAWKAGSAGGTPGVREAPVAPAPPPVPSSQKPAPGSPGGGDAIILDEPCNTTLLITLGATQGSPGDTVAFTIVSSEYASWEAVSDAGVFAYGDTLTYRTHAITLPPNATQARVIAESRACGGRQRATRYITIAQPESPPQETIVAQQPAPAVSAAQETPKEREVEPAAVVEPQAPTRIAGSVVVDEDRSAVPWIVGFAIVTLVTSAVVFLVTHKRERDEDREASAQDPSRAAHGGIADARHTRSSGELQGGLDDGNGVSPDAISDDRAEAKYISPRAALRGDEEPGRETGEAAAARRLD